MTNPDQLENDVNRTRASLSKDVAKLNARVSPSAAVSTRTDKIKSSANSIKSKLMGSAQAAGDKLGSAPGAIKEATDGLAAKAGDATGSAPQTVRDQATGNPIAAGMIAFGVGWLLSSLVPTTTAEQQAVKQVEQNADGLIEPIKASAHEIAGNLEQPVQDSVDALRSTATDAAQQTADHARSATEDVKDNARSAAGDVKDNAREQQNR